MEEADSWETIAKRFDHLKDILQEEVEVEEVK